LCLSFCVYFLTQAFDDILLSRATGDRLRTHTTHRTVLFCSVRVAELCSRQKQCGGGGGGVCGCSWKWYMGGDVMWVLTTERLVRIVIVFLLLLPVLCCCCLIHIYSSSVSVDEDDSNGTGNGSSNGSSNGNGNSNSNGNVNGNDNSRSCGSTFVSARSYVYELPNQIRLRKVFLLLLLLLDDDDDDDNDDGRDENGS